MGLIPIPLTIYSMPYKSRFSINRYFLIPAAAVLLIFILVAAPSAAELKIPAAAGTKGDVVKLHVTVDEIVNLAGIKLVMTYDQKILKFVKAEKTAHTANMLYVVNQRVPGRLIIVMATTKGIAGKDVPLVHMSFELLKNITKEEKISLQISEAELMSDKLKRIKVNFPKSPTSPAAPKD